jgi:hypothetical protein
LAALFAAGATLARRWAWEQDRAVEICVDGRELQLLLKNDPRLLGRALKDLQGWGVSSVGVAWDPDEPLGFAGAFWDPVWPEGLSVTLRPEPAPFGPSPAATPIPDDAPLAIRTAAFLGAGRQVWGYPDLTEIKTLLAGRPWKLPWPEFTRQAGLDALIRAFPGKAVRAHALDDEEVARSAPARVLTRFRRAVRERGIRFLYVRFFPGLSLEKNLAFVKTLTERLREDGFDLAPARPRHRPSSFPKTRQVLAFLATCFLPVIGLRWLWPGPDALASIRPGLSSDLRFSAGRVAALTLWTAASGLLIAALLSTPDFFLGFERFRGVKAALALPLILAFGSLYSSSEIRGLAAKPLTLGLAVAAALAAAVLAVYLLRSGHGSSVAAGAAELRTRDALENFFGVRPRFKEFAIGHPLLWLGFYQLSQRRAGERADGRPWILAGLVGQLSILNTFCHAHTPLAVSLWRTWNGVWLGAAGGLVLIAGVHRLGQRRRPTAG